MTEDNDILFAHYPKYCNPSPIVGDQLATNCLSLNGSEISNNSEYHSTSSRYERFYSDNSPFWSNEQFWRDAQEDRLRAQTTVEFKRFCLMEWIPRSPGLYHMPGSHEHRKRADDILLELPAHERMKLRELDPVSSAQEAERTPVYSLLGKYSMLEGGIGCLRLRDRITEQGRLFFMSATSSGRADEGLVIGLSVELYEHVIDPIIHNGSLTCDIRGRLAFVPDVFSKSYRTGIPKLMVIAEEILPADSGSQKNDLIRPRASAAIIFDRKPDSEFIGKYRFAYAYATFTPGQEGTLNRTVDWLSRYVKAMGGMKVLTDFDEHMSRFEGATFSLARIRDGLVERDSLETYFASDEQTFARHDAINYYINEVHELYAGDVFKGIGSNVTIVNRSSLISTLEYLSTCGNEPLISALRVIGTHVTSTVNEDAAEVLNGLVEEFRQVRLRVPRARAFWDALTSILPNVADLPEASVIVRTIGG